MAGEAGSTDRTQLSNAASADAADRGHDAADRTPARTAVPGQWGDAKSEPGLVFPAAAEGPGWRHRPASPAGGRYRPAASDLPQPGRPLDTANLSWTGRARAGQQSALGEATAPADTASGAR